MKSKHNHGIWAQVVGTLIGVTTTMFGVIPTPARTQVRDNNEGDAIRYFREEVRDVASVNNSSFRNKNT